MEQVQDCAESPQACWGLGKLRYLAVSQNWEPKYKPPCTIILIMGKGTPQFWETPLWYLRSCLKKLQHSVRSLPWETEQIGIAKWHLPFNHEKPARSLRFAFHHLE